MSNIAENVLIDMPDEEYFAIDRTSSSSIRTFRRNRRMYFLEYVSKSLADKDTPALRIGSAVHALALEGQQAYSERFTIGPDCDTRSNMWKEYVEATPSDQTVLNQKDAKKVEFMVKRLWDNIHFQEIMADINPKVENAVFFDMNGADCKAKLDVVGRRPDGTPVILDVKTTGDASPAHFQESSQYWGYVLQAAFYAKALEACGYGPYNEMEAYFAVVDKAFPTTTSVFRVWPEDLEAGHLDNVYQLQEIRNCYESGDWSNEYERTIHRLRY